jgi:hypothetical protein
MNPHSDGKPESNDPHQVMRLLEVELAQRRVALQQARSPYRAFRLASFIFLFAVIVGVALAFYYVFVAGGLDDVRTRTGARATATPAAHAP